MIKRIGAFLLLACVAACSAPPERKTVPVENVTFRLGQTKDGVEIRLESGFYPSSGYELQAAFEGPRDKAEPAKVMDAKALAAGVTLVITPTLVPLEEHGARAPAAALLFLPVGNVDGIAWPLLMKLVQGGATRLDPYTVEHKGGGWLLSRPQGGFSKYEAQGSYLTVHGLSLARGVPLEVADPERLDAREARGSPFAFPSRGKGATTMGWGFLGSVAKGISHAAGDVEHVADDAAHVVDKAAHVVTHFVAKNWKTILVVAASTVVFVAVTALTAGLAGPVLLAAFGSTLVVTAAGIAVGGAASGLTGYLLTRWLDHKGITWKGALGAAALGTVVSLVTAGAGAELTPVGEAVAPIVNKAVPDAVNAAVPAVVKTTAAHAISGAPVSAGGQVLQNAIEGKPLEQGLEQSLVVGAVTGGADDPVEEHIAEPIKNAVGPKEEQPSSQGIVGRLEEKSPESKTVEAPAAPGTETASAPPAPKTAHVSTPRGLGALGEDPN